MVDPCPGAANLRITTLSIKNVPGVAGDVELYSSDISVKCSNCGFVVYNNIASCVQGCRYAKECVGEEMYNKVMAQKNVPVNKEPLRRNQIKSYRHHGILP